VPLSATQYDCVKPLSGTEADILQWAGEGDETVESVLDSAVFALTPELALEDLDRLAGWLPVVRRMKVATTSST
jgi:hypothetical protein